MIKKLILLLLLAVPCVAMAQKGTDMSRYLAGKVPVENGMVKFEKTIAAPGKSQADIYKALVSYTEGLVKASEHKDHSRITSSEESTGVIAASMEEYMYFKRRAWESDFTHFLYQLVFKCSDGKFTATVQRISYIYDEDRNAANALIKAEDCITDEAALKSATKLRKSEGKFRMKTIDRVNEIFDGAAKAVIQ
jgi:hypothetical protein